MSDVDQLNARIDAEFNAAEQRRKDFQKREVQEHLGRQERLERVARLLDEMKPLWRDKLTAVATKFGDRVQITPTVTPARRDCGLKFQSKLASIDLKFAITTDSDVRNVIFTYELRILPILMKFDSHAEISFPLEAIDREKLANWIDDRIVSFVQSYLAIHENQFYVKDVMVEDPVAKVQFPQFAAGATLEQNGQTLYFVGEETKAEYLAKKAR